MSNASTKPPSVVALDEALFQLRGELWGLHEKRQLLQHSLDQITKGLLEAQVKHDDIAVVLTSLGHPPAPFSLPAINS